MTIATTTSRMRYEGNGVTAVFPFTFRILAATHLTVILTDAQGVQTVQVLNVGYTVSGVGNGAGGSITMIVAPGAGETLTIKRAVPLTQPTDLRNQGAFFPEVHESVFDRITMLIQQLDEMLGRSLVLGEDEEDGSGAFDARGNRITDLGAAVDDTDALSLGEFEARAAFSSSTVLPRRWDLVGDGITTVFSIPDTDLVIENGYIVTIDGLVTYDFSVDTGAETITFDDPPADDAVIVVRAFSYSRESSDASEQSYDYGAAGSITRTIAEKLKDLVSVADFGAAPGNTAAANHAGFDAAALVAVSTGRGLLVPPGEYAVYNTSFRFKGEWSGLTAVMLGVTFKYGVTIREDLSVEAGWHIILDGATDGALHDFTLIGVTVDGNRAGVVGFDPGNSSVGIVGYQDSDFENVRVIGARVRSMKQGNGFFTYATGIRFIDCEAYDNDWHGGATSRDTDVGEATKMTEWINFLSHHNGFDLSDGCGLDAGRYHRNVVVNLTSYFNGRGMKFSIGTEYLKVRGADLGYNLLSGFDDTDPVGTANLDLEGIRSHHNGGRGFRVVNATRARFSNITCEDNYCRSGVTRDGLGFTGGADVGSDILIGTGDGSIRYIEASGLVSLRSPTGGILLDGRIYAGFVKDFRVERAETFGYRDAIQSVSAWSAASVSYVVSDIRVHGGVAYECIDAHVSAAATEPGVGVDWEDVWVVHKTDFAVDGGLLIECNQAGTAASAAACAFQCERLGSIKVTGIIFRDQQETPTQHSGMYFSSGVQAFVDRCHFGNGLTVGSEIYTATAPTYVRFGRGNSGSLVTYARGTKTADGGGTSLTQTLTLSNPGGGVFHGRITPKSADAAPVHYLSTLNATTFTVTWTSATAGGTNNVSFGYEAELEIQR